MAFFYKGFVFECGISGPLTIEGNPIEVEKTADGFQARLATGQTFRAFSLRQLAESIIEDSPERATRTLQTDTQKVLLRQGKKMWNASRRESPQIYPMLACASLDGWPLSGFDFSYANLCQAQLRGAQLRGANFHQAILAKADLSGADLTGANFCRTDLYETIFAGAGLEQANLQGVQMVRTDFTNARLIGCTVYGMSAWDVTLEGPDLKQEGLIIRYKPDIASDEELEVKVDDLRMAQFTYLALNNQNLSHVIDAASRKWVLLLGRFSENKEVLQQLAKALGDRENGRIRNQDFIPIIFDFPPPQQRDRIETILLLAGMSAFVIVDITNPKSTPLELQTIAPNYQVPIVPIMKRGTMPFGMFSGLRKFDWVLAPLVYDTPDQLVDCLQTAVIDPAAAKAQSRVDCSDGNPPTRDIREYLIADAAAGPL